MIIVKGKYSGFCFGVQRAIDTAYSLKGKNNVVLGNLIHNSLVVEKLKQNEIKTIYNIYDENLENIDNVIIRTHGEPKSTFDYLKEKNLNIIDCTCPFVKDIQNKVNEYYSKGYKIVVVGDKEHPEVIGINGWCNNSAIITENPEDLRFNKDDLVCIVVQTTYSVEKFDNFIKKFDCSGVKKVDIFKTICYTTNKRQSEALLLSKICDAIIVLGDENSNNTNKLFDICSVNCKNVFRIVNPLNFDTEKIKNFKRVGVVFGASTPIEQFQEVISIMEEVTEVKTESVDTVNEEQANKDTMAAAFASIKPSKDFKIGQIVTAKISSAGDNGLTLSLANSKKDFELSKDEMLEEYNKDNFADKINDTIRVMVVGKNPLRFSEKAMQKVLAEEAEIAEIKNGKLFEAIVTATNKGGLTGKYGSYQVFIPASQIKLSFVKDLDKYIGKTLRLKAEKVESKRKQIVASQRTILLAEKEERDAIKAQKEAEFFSSIQVGDVVLGTPVRFAAFGAFISVNGFDCLAHISDLSWTGCKDCAEVLELNKEYEFKILKIDEETKRVSVGYKQLQPRPWDLVAEKYKAGDIIKGKVVRIVPFGAFVEVEKGIDGLIHVSQISNQYLENPATALEVGQEVEAKILEMNVEKEKMNLSIKALQPEQPAEEKPEEEVAEKPTKGRRKAKKVEETEDAEMREWKDSNDAGTSIADLINNK